MAKVRGAIIARRNSVFSNRHHALQHDRKYKRYQRSREYRQFDAKAVILCGGEAKHTAEHA
jgi:hypothetical protein